MRTILLGLLALLLFQSSALKAAPVPSVGIQATPSTDSSSKYNFFKTPSFYNSHAKASFLQKLEYKIAQKRVKRLLAHHRDEKAPGNSVLSTVALVLGIIAVGTIFIPGVAVVALAAAPAAIITGFIALGKSAENRAARTKAVLGIILGSAVVALFLIALIVLASGGFTF